MCSGRGVSVCEGIRVVEQWASTEEELEHTILQCVLAMCYNTMCYNTMWQYNVLQYNVLQLRASVRQCEVQSTKNTLLDVALHWIQHMLKFLHM